MKRYIQRKLPEYVVVIDVNCDIEVSSVASSKVMHPKSIKNRYKMSEDELRFYNDCIDSVISPILARNFIVLDENQSNRSYAYYIDFYPVDRTGNSFDEVVRILFRIADHNQRHGDVNRVSENLIIKSFTLDGTTYSSSYSLQKKVVEICDHLQDGDFDYVANLRT